MVTHTEILKRDTNKLRAEYELREQVGTKLSHQSQQLKTLRNMGVIALETIFPSISKRLRTIMNILAANKGPKGVLTAPMCAAIEGERYTKSYVAKDMIDGLGDAVATTDYNFKWKQCREIEIKELEEVKAAVIGILKCVYHHEDGEFLPDAGTEEFAHLEATAMGLMGKGQPMEEAKRTFIAAQKMHQVWLQIGKNSYHKKKKIKEPPIAIAHGANLLGIDLTPEEIEEVRKNGPIKDCYNVGHMIPNLDGSYGPVKPALETGALLEVESPSPDASPSVNLDPPSPIPIPIPDKMGGGSVLYAPSPVSPVCLPIPIEGLELGSLLSALSKGPRPLDNCGFVQIGDQDYRVRDVAALMVGAAPASVGLGDKVEPALLNIMPLVDAQSRKSISLMLEKGSYFPSHYSPRDKTPRLVQGLYSGMTLAVAPSAVRKRVIGQIPNLVEVDLSSCYTTLLRRLFPMPELDRLMSSSSFWKALEAELRSELGPKIGPTISLPKPLLKVMWYATLFGGGSPAFMEGYRKVYKDSLVGHNIKAQSKINKAFKRIKAVAEVKVLFATFTKALSDRFMRSGEYRPYHVPFCNGDVVEVRSRKQVPSIISYYFQAYEEAIMSYLTVRCWDSARVVLSQADGAWLYLLKPDGLETALEAVNEICTQLFNNPNVMCLEAVKPIPLSL